MNTNEKIISISYLLDTSIRSVNSNFKWRENVVLSIENINKGCIISVIIIKKNGESILLFNNRKIVES
jgi:hypothetical protein